MSGKGSKRRPATKRDAYATGFKRAFDAFAATDPVECSGCGEIELRPTGVDNMWECSACHHEEQLT